MGDRKAFFEKFAQRCPLPLLEKALECSKHVPFVLHCVAYKLESCSQDTRDKVLALLNAYSFSHWKEIRKSIVNNDDAWAFLDNDSVGMRFLKRVLPEKEVPSETQRTHSV